MLQIRIRMFMGHPDPLVRGADPDPSIIKQKNKEENLDSYCFVTTLGADPDPSIIKQKNKEENLDSYCFVTTL
jgi:hypothetical protein